MPNLPASKLKIKFNSKTNRLISLNIVSRVIKVSIYLSDMEIYTRDHRAPRGIYTNRDKNLLTNK